MFLHDKSRLGRLWVKDEGHTLPPRNGHVTGRFPLTRFQSLVKEFMGRPTDVYAQHDRGCIKALYKTNKTARLRELSHIPLKEATYGTAGKTLDRGWKE
jgi:hypothetical protein